MNHMCRELLERDLETLYHIVDWDTAFSLEQNT